MKLPVKDRATIPWMSQREIPAIKAVLSAWRRLRKDKAWGQRIQDSAYALYVPRDVAKEHASEVACDLELITAIDERLRKEAPDGRA